MACIGITMKIFKSKYWPIVIFFISFFFLSGCSGSYDLQLGNDYYLCRNDSYNRYIMKKGHTFFNYSKKGINLQECLEKNPIDKSNCYGLSGNYIVESNVIELGVTPSQVLSI